MNSVRLANFGNSFSAKYRLIFIFIDEDLSLFTLTFLFVGTR